MPLKTSKYIWHEGKLVPWEHATVHVLSHALHYGSGVFEGIRAYWNAEQGQLYLLKLREHYERILDYIKPDFVHVLAQGQIVRSGGPELAHELAPQGRRVERARDHHPEDQQGRGQFARGRVHRQQADDETGAHQCPGRAGCPDAGEHRG